MILHASERLVRAREWSPRLESASQHALSLPLRLRADRAFAVKARALLRIRRGIHLHCSSTRCSLRVVRRRRHSPLRPQCQMGAAGTTEVESESSTAG